MQRGRLYSLLTSSLFGVAILLGLGFWQLDRLQWKRALLDDLIRAVSMEAPFLPLADAEEVMRREPSRDYLRVKLKGKFDHSAERYLFSVADREMGWRVITPFFSRDGRIVLIDRGFVPDSLKHPQSRPGSLNHAEIELPGLLRRPGKASFFTPSNNPDRNTWHWLDVPAIFASLKNLPAGERSEFVVVALPSASAYAWPRPMPPDPTAIPNNHLQYALTWFALALILALMTFLFVRKELRHGNADPS
jgi:surfeit locus 1 family protein